MNAKEANKFMYEAAQLLESTEFPGFNQILEQIRNAAWLAQFHIIIPFEQKDLEEVQNAQRELEELGYITNISKTSSSLYVFWTDTVLLEN